VTGLCVHAKRHLKVTKCKLEKTMTLLARMGTLLLLVGCKLAASSLRSKLGLKESDQVFSAYVTDWAHYRAAPYTWSPSDYSGIASRTDVALYSFIYFCPPAGTSPMPYWASYPYGQCGNYNEYELLSVDPIDATGIKTIGAMGPKVVLSVGGWNFPSAYFSKMASSSESRAKFVKSVKSWMDKYGAAGIDLDWEYPCSAARTDPVKITCSKFQTVHDTGGSCPEDSDNLLLLVQDLRAGLGENAIISIASQAGLEHAGQMNLKAVTEFIDMWHVMSYDYAVSDVTGQSSTSPNAPLYIPTGGVKMSINQTVTYYVDQGVPKDKIMVGLPLYAHSWYVPGLKGDEWKKFGLAGAVQGECCGVFKSTYGAKPGKGCQLCGSMMWSEIKAAQPESFYDNQTQTVIGYWESMGADGYTEAGTWITYNDLQSVKAIAEWQVASGLAGTFIYSADMDTKEYEFMNTIADALGKGSGPRPGPTPGPGPTPTPQPAPGTTTCCWSKWGDSNTCGNYPAGSGGKCNTDWSKSCNGNSNC